MRLVGLGAAAACLAVAAVLARRALGPHRNVIGNEYLQERLAECRVPNSDVTIRLYEGGGGATVALASSVTIQHGHGRELQFFHTYASPIVRALRCQPGGVELVTLTGTGPRWFGVAEIDSAYTPRPLNISRDRAERLNRADVEAERPDFNDWMRLWGAAVLLASSVLLVVLALRRRADAT